MEGKDLSIQGWYNDGIAFAREVQAGLREGKTFNEMNAAEPERAAHIRDLQEDESLRAWWRAYVSCWD